MCPLDDSHLTIEFDDHYVIQPSIAFWGGGNPGYAVNVLGESGRPVTDGFEYNSGTNPQFLSNAEILEYNRMADTE